jgi:hypothetical protein
MKPCDICGATHISVLCDDRDMTVLGICRICAGLIRECYKHKANLATMQHLKCVGSQPVSEEYYASQVKFLSENKEYCNKLIPIPSHVVSPEDFGGKKCN